MASWYEAGTVSVSNGNRLVTGVDTIWTVVDVKAGDGFWLAGEGQPVEIEQVISPTEILLVSAWSGAAATAQNYIIQPIGRAHTDAGGLKDRLDQLTQRLKLRVEAGVLSANITTPPADPEIGDRYIVPTGAGDVWSDLADYLATWQGERWEFLKPVQGMFVYNHADNSVVAYEGTSWVVVVGGGGGLDLDKAASADTDKFLEFSTGGAGFARIGGIGEDKLGFFTSTDGTNFEEALIIDPATGAVTLPKSNYLSGALNVCTDGGRFLDDISQYKGGLYQEPGYFKKYSCTISEHGRYYYNTSTYGGTAAALTPEIAELMVKCRDSDNIRRYHTEFCVLDVEHAGTTSAKTVDGQTYYATLAARVSTRAAVQTAHMYLKAQDADIHFQLGAGQLYRDGVLQAGTEIVITPADGWVVVLAIAIQDDLGTFRGYSPTPFIIRSQNTGDSFLLACLAVIIGSIRIDPKQLLVETLNWQA